MTSQTAAMIQIPLDIPQVEVLSCKLRSSQQYLEKAVRKAAGEIL